MTDLSATWNGTLLVLVITGTMAAFQAQPAVAQAARNLDCIGCVSSIDIKNNGIKSKDIKNGQVKRADLANGAVTGAKVKDGSLTANDLAAGVLFGSTVMVRADGASALANCDTLRNALAGIKGAGPENPVVIKLERGIYDCGVTTLALVPYVTIEGAGRDATRVVGDVDGFDGGVIKGAREAALRYLAVEHRGNLARVAIAISTAGSDMSISDVAVKADSTTANQVFGIRAEGGSLDLSNVSVRARAAAGQSQGIRGEAGAVLSMINVWVHNQSGAVGNPAALELRDSSATGFGVLFSSNFFGLLGRGNSSFDLMDGTVIGGRGATAGAIFSCVAIADEKFDPRDPDCR